MKKQLFALALVAASIGANAQTVYDAANISDTDLSGTARFVGMGGAMSALGGDISTISTNPAGIGIYRKRDVSASLSYNVAGTQSNYAGSSLTAHKYRWTFDNMGFVISTKVGNETPLRYVNFGFSYNKAKNFNRNTSLKGNANFTLGGLSQSFLMTSMADGLDDTDWDTDVSGNHYTNNDISWLSALGYDSYITNYQTQNSSTYYTSEATKTAYMREFKCLERGGLNDYNFNVAFNVNDRMYFGITLTAHDLDYRKETLYDEDWNNGGGYILNSYNRVHGAGFDAKFGAIFRPFEEQPLRIGLAIHTPAFYNLTYTTGASISSDIVNSDGTISSHSIDTYDELGNCDMDRDFNLTTPWLFNVSLGYTAGKMMAFDAEYQYQDYGTTRFGDAYTDTFDFENNEARLCLRGVNTARFGVELRPTPEFSVRLGYNYQSAIYRNNALKYLPYNSINTDTDFQNTRHRNTVTAGLGWKSGNVYVDLAYKYDIRRGDFYPFYNEDDNNNISYPSSIDLRNDSHKVMMTVGYRF